MKKPDFQKGWEAFLRWTGWQAAASACKKAWHVTIRWAGWRILFGLPIPLVLLLSVACAAGLIWVFAKGMETQLTAYFLYPLSAYSMTALCVKLPVAIRGAKAWLSCHPKLAAFWENKELHFQLGLYREQIINFAYGSFKIVSGVIVGEFSDVAADPSMLNNLETAILEAVGNRNIPVVFDFPAGHGCQNMPLILGANVDVVVGDNVRIEMNK